MDDEKQVQLRGYFVSMAERLNHKHFMAHGFVHYRHTQDATHVIGVPYSIAAVSGVPHLYAFHGIVTADEVGTMRYRLAERIEEGWPVTFEAVVKDGHLVYISIDITPPRGMAERQEGNHDQR